MRGVKRGVLADAERAPGFRSDDTVYGQAVLGLHVLHRGLRFGSECAISFDVQSFL